MCLYNLTWERETSFLKEKLLHTKWMCHPHSSSPWVCLKFSFEQNWKLTFPRGQLNLIAKSYACNNIPRSEREKGILAVIVSPNTQFRQEVTEHFLLHLWQALWTALSFDTPSSTEGPLCSLKGTLWSLLPNGS